MDNALVPPLVPPPIAYYKIHFASYAPTPPPQVQIPLGENWNVTDLNLGRPTRTPSKELLRTLYLQRLRALKGIDEMLDTLGKALPGPQGRWSNSVLPVGLQ